MTATPQKIKNKLRKELDIFLGTHTISEVAKKSKKTTVAVRMYFSTPERQSPVIDKAAFDLLTELKADIQRKQDVINK